MNLSIVSATEWRPGRNKPGGLLLSRQIRYCRQPRGLFYLLLLLIYALPVTAEQRSGEIHVPAKVDMSRTLRVLYHQENTVNDAIRNELRFINDFAEQEGLFIEQVKIAEEWQLVNALLSGKGDIIIGKNLTVAGGIRTRLIATLPLSIVDHQQVVSRTGTTLIRKIEDLFSHQVALKKSSPYWDLMSEYAKQHRTMDLIQIPEDLDTTSVLQLVANGRYDITFADSAFLDNYLPEHPELSAVFNLTDAQARTWLLREQDHDIRESINQYLNKYHFVMKSSGTYFGDLPEIQQRKRLRVITYPNAANYFMNNGRQSGFEYDLVRRFAKSHFMEVEIIVAESHAEMQSLLTEGKGDVIAASLPGKSISDPDIGLSRAYNYVAPVVVGRNTDDILLDARELAGRRITLANESPYKYLIERVKQKGIDVDTVLAPDEISIENTLLMVSLGMYDLTILGGHQLNKEYMDKFGVKPVLTLKEPEPQRWAVRADNTQLLTAINEFIDTNYKGRTYNILYTRYFGEKGILDNGSIQLAGISPYDEPVKKYADRYGFDWRLIIAQMFQESRFDPEAVSDAGARGLMQIMPPTAEFLKMDTEKDPLTNIHAGIKYLGILRDQFEQDLVLEEKTWFSLASYNAGFNRVKHARELAEQMGMDKNRWFGNVEKAMLILAKPYFIDGELKRKCKCGQTVAYVREIRSLYNNYIQITQSIKLAESKHRLIKKLDS